MERKLKKVMSAEDFKTIVKEVIDEYEGETIDLMQQEGELTTEIYPLFFNEDGKLKYEIINEGEYNCPLTGKEYKNLKSMLKNAIRFKLDKMVHQAKEELVAND